MKKRSALGAAVSALLLLLLACEQQSRAPADAQTTSVPATADAQEVGACRGGAAEAGASREVMGLVDRIHFAGAWLELSPREARQSFARALEEDSGAVIEVDTSQADVLSGEDRDAVFVDREPAEDAKAAAMGSASIAVGADVSPEDPTHLVVRLTTEGDIAFMANCHYRRYTKPFYDFVSDTGQSSSPAELLREVLRRDGAAWQALREWSEPGG